MCSQQVLPFRIIVMHSGSRKLHFNEVHIFVMCLYRFTFHYELYVHLLLIQLIRFFHCIHLVHGAEMCANTYSNIQICWKRIYLINYPALLSTKVIDLIWIVFLYPMVGQMISLHANTRAFAWPNSQKCVWSRDWCAHTLRQPVTCV